MSSYKAYRITYSRNKCFYLGGYSRHHVIKKCMEILPENLTTKLVAGRVHDLDDKLVEWPSCKNEPKRNNVIAQEHGVLIEVGEHRLLGFCSERKASRYIEKMVNRE